MAPPPQGQWAGASLPPPLSFVFLQDCGFYFPLGGAGQGRWEPGTAHVTWEAGGRWP